VDCAYTNSLDHAFDLDKITAEIRRVVRPSGIFLVDIVYGHDEGYVPGGHDAMHWPRARDFAALLAEKTGFALTSFRDLGPHGSMLWTQAVLRKQA
jgi:SAM-dependent methyltransferase